MTAAERPRAALCAGRQTAGERRHSLVALLAIVMKEKIMSKGQRGNKEAKKPKKNPAKPLAPGGSTPTETPAVPARPKR